MTKYDFNLVFSDFGMKVKLVIKKDFFRDISIKGPSKEKILLEEKKLTD
jgi:hypothetical protein